MILRFSDWELLKTIKEDFHAEARRTQGKSGLFSARSALLRDKKLQK